MNNFDVAKWNKQRYLAEANLLESTADQVATEINKAIDVVDKNLSYMDFALAVAKILKEEYGSQNFGAFMNVLNAELGMNETLNEAEYTWKNDRELPNQEGRAIGELSDLIYDLENYISPNIRGLRKTKTLQGLATSLAADEIRGFVSVYRDDLAGIKVFQQGNNATWEPIWKDKEPTSISGPDPRGAGSLD
jgi:hypothetical protein